MIDELKTIYEREEIGTQDFCPVVGEICKRGRCLAYLPEKYEKTPSGKILTVYPAECSQLERDLPLSMSKGEDGFYYKREGKIMWV